MAGICFGTSGTASTFAPESAHPLSIGAARMAFGGTLMALIGLGLWAAKRRGKPSGITHPKGRLVTFLAIAVAGMGVLGYQATFFIGTQANGVAVGTVIALGTSPLFAGVFEWIVLRHPPGWIWVGATALAVLGVISLTLVGSSVTQTDPVGVLASAGAGACYAAYVVSTKWVLENGWHPQDVASLALGLGAALAFVMLPFTNPAWAFEPRGIAVIAWLAAVSIALPYLFIGSGLKGLSAATAATLTLAEPATASLLGIFLLGEHLTWNMILGLVFIIAAVMVLSIPKPSRHSAAA
jgi:DME family drug/metabolite transporter